MALGLDPTNDWGKLSTAERIELVLRTFQDMRIRPLDWTPEALAVAKRGRRLYERLKGRKSFGESAWRARLFLINLVLNWPGDGKARRLEWKGEER